MSLVLAQLVDNLIDTHSTSNIMKCVESMVLTKALFKLMQTFYIYIYIYIYRVSQEECARLRENVPNVKVHRYNPKHLYPKLNGYGDNGQRSMKV